MNQPAPAQAPLPLYLSMEVLLNTHSLHGLLAARSGSLSWKPSLQKRAEALQQQLAKLPPETLAHALKHQSHKALEELYDGLQRYQQSPHTRPIANRPVIWQKGSTRLLDYSSSSGTPVLCVPSLINRPYILDLSPTRSMLSYMATQGLSPYLLDWGEPAQQEQHYSCSDYITERLEAALDALPEPVALMGYCMGGMMALAAALRRPDKVRSLILLATPWDFHADGVKRALFSAEQLQHLEHTITSHTTFPPEVIQHLFYTLHSPAIHAKFRRLGKIENDDSSLAEWMDIEHWLHDGISMTAQAVRECFIDWAGYNNPLHGNWYVGGKKIDPSALAMSSLVIIPERDKIVPPHSTEPLLHHLPNATTLRLNSGHIRMVAGSEAKQMVWEPVCEFVRGA